MKDKIRLKIGEHGYLTVQININGIWTDVNLHDLDRVEE